MVDSSGESVDQHRGPDVPLELNILALIKDSERFVYVFDDDSRDALVDHFQSQATDPENTINWFDAAVLQQRARQQVEGAAESEPNRMRDTD